jgi:hypothetical protein
VWELTVGPQDRCDDLFCVVRRARSSWWQSELASKTVVERVGEQSEREYGDQVLLSYCVIGVEWVRS